MSAAAGDRRTPRDLILKQTWDHELQALVIA
jgi:hypothetical protein